MGGSVVIKFEKTRTVFTLSAHLDPCLAPKVRRPNTAMGTLQEEKQFDIPPDTWGVVIDDSRSQRKVLNVFLKLIGIQKER